MAANAQRVRRNVVRVCKCGVGPSAMYSETVDWATSMPPGRGRNFKWLEVNLKTMRPTEKNPAVN